MELFCSCYYVSFYSTVLSCMNCTLEKYFLGEFHIHVSKIVVLTINLKKICIRTQILVVIQRHIFATNFCVDDLRMYDKVDDTDTETANQ